MSFLSSHSSLPLGKIAKWRHRLSPGFVFYEIAQVFQTKFIFHSYFSKRIALNGSQCRLSLAQLRAERTKYGIVQVACLLYFAFNVNALENCSQVKYFARQMTQQQQCKLIENIISIDKAFRSNVHAQWELIFWELVPQILQHNMSTKTFLISPLFHFEYSEFWACNAIQNGAQTIQTKSN